MQHNGKTVQADATTTQVDTTTMQADATTMQVDATTMQVDATTMQADAVTAQADATTMQVDAITAQPSARSRRHLMAYRNNASIEQRLLTAQVTIEEVLADVALQDALAPYGYDLPRLMQGKALRDQAQALAQQQGARTADQRRARAARDTTQTQARAFFKGQLALARAALRDEPGAAQALNLGTRKRSRAGWLMQAQQFYANALNDVTILEKLAVFGMTRQQLELGQSRVAAVAAGMVAYQQRKGVKQESTRARDTALAALDRWMQDFNVAARVALAEV